MQLSLELNGGEAIPCVFARIAGPDPEIIYLLTLRNPTVLGLTSTNCRVLASPVNCDPYSVLVGAGADRAGFPVSDLVSRVAHLKMIQEKTFAPWGTRKSKLNIPTVLRCSPPSVCDLVLLCVRRSCELPFACRLGHLYFTLVHSHFPSPTIPFFQLRPGTLSGILCLASTNACPDAVSTCFVGALRSSERGICRRGMGAALTAEACRRPILVVLFAGPAHSVPGRLM